MLNWKSKRDCVHFTKCNRFVIHPIELNWGNNGRAQYNSVVMYDYLDIKKPVERTFASLKEAKQFASMLVSPVPKPPANPQPASVDHRGN